MMNKIVAISMVKNEADIIESFVRHTLSFADELLIVDHCSTDATKKILELLRDEGLPLTIDTFRNPAYLQAEVMTSLMYRAVEEHQADIVVPLDADEFLLSRAEGQPVRAVLQGMPDNKVFAVDWVTYCPVSMTNEPDVFLLNRNCYKKVKPEEEKKCITGKTAIMKNKLKLCQGSHHVTAEDEKVIFPENDWTTLFLAHFNWRSESQLLSKALGGWLANVARYSKYTIIALQWKEKFNRFCADEEQELMELNPVDYEIVGVPSAEKVVLRYSRLVKTEVMQNVLLAAEAIAHSLAVRSTLEKISAVTVLLLLSDDREQVRRTLDSVKNQLFPRIEVFLLDFSGGNNALAEEMLAEYQPDFPVYCISAGADGESILCEAAKQSHGEYVQFLQSGDVLQPEKITAMLTAMDKSVNKAPVAYCDSPAGKQAYFWEGTVPWEQTSDYNELKGPWLLNMITGAAVPLSGHIAGFLFRRELLNKIDWLADAFVGGRLMLFSAYRKIFSECGIVGVLQEKLVVADCTAFAETYIWYQIEERLWLEEQHSKGRPDDEEYARIAGMQKRIAEAISFAEKSVPAELYAEYLKIVGSR